MTVFIKEISMFLLAKEHVKTIFCYLKNHHNFREPKTNNNSVIRQTLSKVECILKHNANRSH